MGTDNSANAGRSIAETVRYAGIYGIALPSHQMIRLTIYDQYDFTFQYGANFLTLMFDPLPVVVPGW